MTREFNACAKRIDIENRLYSDELGILAMGMRPPKFRLRDLRSHFRTQIYRARLTVAAMDLSIQLLEGRTSRPSSYGTNNYIFVSPENKAACLQETKKGFRTACRLAGIEGLIWKDLRATFGTRLAEAGCDAFTIAQLLGHSDIRVTMRYVRTVEESNRAAVEAVQLNSRMSSIG